MIFSKIFALRVLFPFGLVPLFYEGDPTGGGGGGAAPANQSGTSGGASTHQSGDAGFGGQAGSQPDTFSRDYVSGLRSEAASWRTKAQEAKQQNEGLTSNLSALQNQIAQISQHLGLADPNADPAQVLEQTASNLSQLQGAYDDQNVRMQNLELAYQQGIPHDMFDYFSMKLDKAAGMLEEGHFGQIAEDDNGNIVFGDKQGEEAWNQHMEALVKECHGISAMTRKSATQNQSPFGSQHIPNQNPGGQSGEQTRGGQPPSGNMNQGDFQSKYESLMKAGKWQEAMNLKNMAYLSNISQPGGFTPGW